ncbi:MAG: hypothetical protein BroJett015_44970 [Chloroflexota bacterium]|nr:MAG: hypothetical protein BroJett015_44970 [Chloroflexota bacterium]
MHGREYILFAAGGLRLPARPLPLLLQLGFNQCGYQAAQRQPFHLVWLAAGFTQRRQLE